MCVCVHYSVKGTVGDMKVHAFILVALNLAEIIKHVHQECSDKEVCDTRH